MCYVFTVKIFCLIAAKLPLKPHTPALRWYLLFDAYAVLALPLLPVMVVVVDDTLRWKIAAPFTNNHVQTHCVNEGNIICAWYEWHKWQI